MSSQQQEDEIIAKYFKNKENGKYIDIGAGEAEYLSNTYELYKKGWTGLVIEPFEKYKNGWAELRPKDILLPVAVSSVDGTVEMATTGTVGSWVGDEYKARGDETYTVDCMTMPTILDKYPEFKDADFVSIDIESMELPLLSKWNFDQCRPELICIERQLRGIDRRQEWEHLLFPYYVTETITYTNAFYKRR